MYQIINNSVFKITPIICQNICIIISPTIKYPQKIVQKIMLKKKKKKNSEAPKWQKCPNNLVTLVLRQNR